MTLHFPDQAATNLLTIDEFDPKSGTAEFKACAVRVQRVKRLESTLDRGRDADRVALAGD
jgi:formate dehydrogenase major subunit